MPKVINFVFVEHHFITASYALQIFIAYARVLFLQFCHECFGFVFSRVIKPYPFSAASIGGPLSGLDLRGLWKIHTLVRGT